MTDASKRFAWFPVAIGIYLVYVQWAERTGAGMRDLIDLAGSAAAVVGLAAVGWLMGRRLTTDVDRRALISLAVVLWGGLFLSFQMSVFAFVSEAIGRPLTALLIWSVLIALLIGGLVRTDRPLGAVSRALDLTSLFLLLFAGASLVRGGSASAGSQSIPDERRLVVERGPARPDIYVIVLDKYSSGPWLEAVYGLDHRPFEDSLRALGFSVPRGARANYTHTQLSLVSMLEGAYLDPSADTLSWASLGARIERATLWRRLQDRGYRYAFFPTTFSATRRSTPSDLLLTAPSPSTTRAGETWWVNSPVRVIVQRLCVKIECSQRTPSMTPYPAEGLEELTWKLGMLATLPDSAGPIVAFAHILTPHEPYLFDADCSAREAWWPHSDVSPGSDARIRAAYATQVQCLDRLVLSTVTEIVRRSTVPPVILLQSDHGHGRFAVDIMRGITLELEQLTEIQLGERFGVFAAYRFPGAQETVPDDISPVNVLRLALRPILGDGSVDDDSALLPTRSFWSAYQTPFQFIELAPERLAPPPSTP